jgi:hypothetical protein
MSLYSRWVFLRLCELALNRSWPSGGVQVDQQQLGGEQLPFESGEGMASK